LGLEVGVKQSPGFGFIGEDLRGVPGRPEGIQDSGQAGRLHAR
jgi:hypothetical protein